MTRLADLAARGALVALACVAGLWAAAYLTWPFGWDHGVFAWVGDVILRGGMPYRDAFDVKGPISFYPSAAVMAAAGRNWWGIRLFDLVLVAITAYLVLRIATRFSDRGIGTAAALLWVLAYANTGFMNTAQPDGWVAWLLLLSCAPLLLSDTPVRPRHMAMIAAAAAVASLLKPIYLLYLLLPAAVAWSDTRPAPVRTRHTGIAIAAFVLPIVAVVLYFGWRGALGAFGEAYITFNAGKNSAGLGSAASDALSYGFVNDPMVLLGLPLAVAGIAALARRHPRAALLLGLWLVISIPLVLVQRPYYPYRLHIVSPVIAALAAAALAALRPATARETAAGHAGTWLAGAGALLACIVFARHPLGEGLRWVRLATGSLPRAQYYARYPVWMATAGDEAAAARQLATSSRPDELVFAWNHPGVAVLAGRELVPRLSIETPVSLRAPAAARERYLAELARTLGEARPAIVVTEDTLGVAESCLACLPPFAALGAAGDSLAAPYRLVFRSGRLVMYRRGPE